MEVHTPVISQDTVVDRHIDPIQLPRRNLGLAEADDATLYLQTSPEFGMKRLLAAGLEAIYQIGPAFRSGEVGAFHNPEFTMVEWYQVGDDLQRGIQLLSDLVQVVIKTPPAEIATYQSVFLSHTGCDPLAAPIDDFADAARRLKLSVPDDWSGDKDDWLHLIFSECVQPQLGHERPIIVTHYPASQSALARISPDGKTAERFELFIQGIELANGYHELVDPDELDLRNRSVNAERTADGKAALPGESRLLEAMRAGMPACSGCALGLDRLVMIAVGAKSLDEVIAFPIARA